MESENGTDETICRAAVDTQPQKRLVDPGVEGECGMN